ncbi:hypothetical protein P3T24_005164 [Paraburkholderia sp. GAS33]
MTTRSVPTPQELIEQLRSTRRSPFTSTKVRSVDAPPAQDSISSQETYERLRQEFDDNTRGGVSLTRLATR